MAVKSQGLAARMYFKQMIIDDVNWVGFQPRYKRNFLSATDITVFLSFIELSLYFFSTANQTSIGLLGLPTWSQWIKYSWSFQDQEYFSISKMFIHVRKLQLFFRSNLWQENEKRTMSV